MNYDEAEAALRGAVREAMIARTAYWYHSVTCSDDLREQIEGEVDGADREYESALDALLERVRRDGRVGALLDVQAALFPHKFVCSTCWPKFEALAEQCEGLKSVGRHTKGAGLAEATPEEAR